MHNIFNKQNKLVYLPQLCLSEASSSSRVLVIFLFISPWRVLADCSFQGICPFHGSCQNSMYSWLYYSLTILLMSVWYVVISSILLLILVICISFFLSVLLEVCHFN